MINKIKVILPVKHIPDDSIVTKKNGSKQYVVRNSIKIYNEDHSSREIKCEEGTRFILPANASEFGVGTINVICANTEMLWEVEISDMIGFLYHLGEEKRDREEYKSSIVGKS